ncbi:MAG TPA: hypothetical protein VGN97_15385 [Mesorhizobium sp.]|jgi:hypothetical protein|nr:hypothetical protein [Mesorhizobium sp.]
MLWVEVLALTFLAGLTTAGTAATLFEFAARRELRFARPFVSSDRLPRSVLVTLLAGSFMLCNDALNARREGLLSGLGLGACGLAAALWVLGWGAAVLALAAGLFSSLA